MQDKQHNGRWMWRWASAAMAGAFLAMAHGTMAQATPKPPERMTYQGFLTGSDGVALGNTAPKAYDVLFRIFDAEQGGTLLWGEQQTVTVDKGYFSVLLGEGAAVTGIPNSGITLSSLFSGATASDRYVGFTVKGIGTGGADVDILPRVRLMTSPYAFLAGRALNADAASKLVQASGADLLSSSGGQVLLSGALGVGSTNIIEFGQGVATKNADSGKIGYGTFSGDSLDIVGAGNSQGNRKVRFYSDGGVTSDGPFTAPRINTENIYVNGVGGVFFGNGRAKQYPLNGLIAYNSIDGADQLIIHGGGLNEGSRRVIMFCDAGFRVLGPQSVRGVLGIEGNWVFELGQGTTKEPHAARIGYGAYTANELDIVGGGTTADSRRITFHTQGGIRTLGALNVNTTGYHKYPLAVFGQTSDGFSGFFEAQISCKSVYAFSDARAKDVVGVSDAGRDLDALRRVRVTDYRMKEDAVVGSPMIKGVIAQEIRTVLPDAVKAGAHVLPNILKDAVGVEWAGPGKPVLVRMAEAHGIQRGDQVSVAVDGQQRMIMAGDVPDPVSFTFDGVTEAPKKVRVIGREVKDFLSVDYQQVYMTAVSALQEVDRQVQGLHKEVARIAELERKAARVDAMERDIAELRKLVAAMAAPGAKGKESAAVGTT